MGQDPRSETDSNFVRKVVRIAMCICTSGRPAALARCLDSIAEGSKLPAEVIVSDDSLDLSMAAQVKACCASYEFARYVSGPRRGLCANRNHVIRTSRGTHVSLLDDDGTLGLDFVERAEALAAGMRNTILTGDVLEGGSFRQQPTNPRFLGHFGRPPRGGEGLENINLNCNLFPRNAFNVASFDEEIVYGYEDTDLCVQLLIAGFHIRYVPELVNAHHPPPRSAAEQFYVASLAERARLRMLWRKWVIHRQRPVVGRGVYAAARVHALLSVVRSKVAGGNRNGPA